MTRADLETRIQEILEVEQRWTQAHLDLDLDMLNELLADDYLQLGPGGQLIDKKAMLHSYQSGERHWEIAESSDHIVRLHGSVAALIGIWRGKGTHAGVPFDYSARFLALYRWEEGGWRLYSDVSQEIV
jgi:ketosteroid isomerase-like protein